MEVLGPALPREGDRVALSGRGMSRRVWTEGGCPRLLWGEPFRLPNGQDGIFEEETAEAVRGWTGQPTSPP